MDDAGVQDRRRFVKQTLAWSAMAAMPRVGGAASKPAPDADAAHVLVLGDWGWLDTEGPEDLRGGDRFAAQTQVARGMQRYARRLPKLPEALFLLGDSWYGDLPDGASSARWRTQFEQMYPAEVFPGPAYTMLGNHDYQRLPITVNKVEAELEYARSGRGLDGRPTRWTLPSRWYSFDFPAHRPMMRCVVLDSNMPTVGWHLPHPTNFTLTPEQKGQQIMWLEKELARPRSAPFLVVMAHHPVFSNGPHGDHPVLVRDWDPLFRRYGVDLYMAGHDHDLQVLEFAGHPTTHFLSGGGGADLYVLRVDDMERGPYAQEVHGFSHLMVTPRAMELRHLDADGRFLFGVRKPAGGGAAVAVVAQG